MNATPRRHYIRMIARSTYLFFIKPSDCGGLVTKSYDRISDRYDRTWTHHMRHLTESLIDRFSPQPGQRCVDLTCGTGFATHLIATRTSSRVIGVDRSAGMLAQARANYGDRCDFVQADILEYLKGQDAGSVDLVTCCWGLGYSRPFCVLRQIARVLRPGGTVAIIDNSLFSLREVLACSFLTFAEQPEKLKNLMRFTFLPGSRTLATMFRLLGLKPSYTADGSQSYTVASGEAAIRQLRATGAAAGFEYASDDADEEAIFSRFAEILEERHLTPEGLTITHRYLAGIARK